MFIKYKDNAIDMVKMLHKEYGDIVNMSGLAIGPKGFFLFRLDHIKELFINQADYFSRRPTDMWLVNKLFKKKGKRKPTLCLNFW